MRRFLSLDFVWQFAGGFVLGAVALLAVQSDEANAAAAPTSQIEQAL